MGKAIRYILSIVAVAISLCACDKNDDIPSGLYQQYEVLVQNGQALAFANLRQGGAAGECVNVGNEALTVNMLPMYYSGNSTINDEFTYATTLSTNHTKAIFRFRNSAGKTLENTSDFSAMPQAELVNSQIYEVEGGDRVEINLNGASEGDVTVYLVGMLATAEPERLMLMRGSDFGTAYVTLPDVSGLYDIVIDTAYLDQVAQSDGDAGGSIHTVLRVRRSLKISL